MQLASDADQSEVLRLEGITHIINSLKYRCTKMGMSLAQMEFSNTMIKGCLMELTTNTYIMVVVPDELNEQSKSNNS